MKLFLDIDGVMVHANPHRTVEHEEDGFYRFNLQAIEALNMLIKEMNIEEIILSTSHRFNFNPYKSLYWVKGHRD
ncbi:HAD domain-containing protein [Ignatzschineria sp. LJL83]